MDKLNQITQANIGKIAHSGDKSGRSNTSKSADGLEFSKHLLERINRRNLQVGPEETRKLSEAIDKAEAKGSRDSLVLLNDLAFIVSVNNRRVVTAIDKSQLNEGVFTNIDSAIII